MTSAERIAQATEAITNGAGRLHASPQARNHAAGFRESFLVTVPWLLLVFVIAFRPQEIWPIVRGARLAMMAKLALLAGLLSSGYRWRYRVPQFYASVGLVGAIALSVPFSYYPGYSFRIFITECRELIVFLVCISCVRSLKLVHRSLWLCMASYTTACVWALVTQTNRARIGGITLDTAGNSDFGIVLVLSVGIALGMLSSYRRPLVRFLLVGILGVCGFGVIRTGSRGTLLALIAMIIVWVLLSPRRLIHRAVTVGIVAALAVALLLPTGRLSRQMSMLELGDLPEARYRVALMRGALRMFCDYPLTGVGAGCFARAYLDYRRKDFRYESPWGRQWIYCHNKYLMVMAETGLAGILSILALHLCTLQGLFRVVRSGEKTGVFGGRECLAQALLLALFGSCIGVMFVPGLSVPFEVLIVLSVAVCYGPPSRSRRASGRSVGHIGEKGAAGS
ncbi:MAG: O-antigen ligase family protein [Planctomycetes bacterium]|nr:O-antigen ligase family protein [Planctomycetota bacterium]